MRSRLLASFVVSVLAFAAPAPKEVTVYTYDDRPPFVVDKGHQSGLEYQLCSWLNEQSAGAYHFTLKVVTAPEAKGMVERKELNGVLMGVNKAWFPEWVGTTYLWTAPILWDRNEVVSTMKHKVDYAGPDSLAGKTLAGVKGFAYPAITAAVAAGKIHRVDTDSEMASLGLVAKGQADVTIVSQWTLLYAQLRLNVEGDFYQSNKPFSEFVRCIMVPPDQKALFEHLSKFLKDVRKEDTWQKATAL